MKKYILDFFKRGLLAMGGGPIVWTIVYAILGASGVVSEVSVWEVVLGVLTVSFMAFIAAGITVVYRIEELPLLYATLLHGVALYLDYIMIYLLNGWLSKGILPFVIFTGSFIVGYALIWVIVYLVMRKSTKKLNKRLS